MVTRWADRIAYISHDVDDAIRAGVLSEDDIPAGPRRVLGSTYRDRLDSMVRALVARSAEVEAVAMPDEVAEAMGELQRVPVRARVPGRRSSRGGEGRRRARTRCARISVHILTSFRDVNSNDDIDQRVIDYVSGMTDRFAMRAYEDRFLPQGSREPPLRQSDDVDEVRERADIVEVIGEHVRLQEGRPCLPGLMSLPSGEDAVFQRRSGQGLVLLPRVQSGGQCLHLLRAGRRPVLPRSRRVSRPALRRRAPRSSRRAARGRLRARGCSRSKRPRSRSTSERLAAKDAETVRAYLESRGITPELDGEVQDRIRRLAPRRLHPGDAARRMGSRCDELTAAGLATRDAQGPCDTFYGRVLFPIFDPAGRAGRYRGPRPSPRSTD